MSDLERRISDLETEVSELKRQLGQKSKVSLRRAAKNSYAIRRLGKDIDDYKRTSAMKRK